jgi:hypothetical protein
MNRDFESIIDKWILKAARAETDSDAHLKLACIYASPVVGRYDGGTQEIARLTRRSVSSIENRAHAHWCYKELRANGNKPLVRRLWRSLPASHWWQAYDIQRAGYDALYYLELADAHSFSVRAMMAEWNKDREAGHAPLILKRAVLSFRGLAMELMDKHAAHLTVGQRKAVKAVMEAFE